MQLNRIKNTILWAGLATLVTTALLACGGGGSTPTTPPAATTFVSGVVKNASGSPVQGATVTTSGQSITTGADGSFKLDASKSVDTAVVLVKKSGFTTTAKEVPLTTDANTQIDIQLLADQVSTTFSAATAASIAVSNAQVQIPANAIKTTNGADFTGTVYVGASYYSPDTVQGAQAFAGPYTGTDAGVQSPIISMGFMEVKLTDAAGNLLQLKAPATLTFPASSNSANAASVPLWFYDEAAAMWKREGTATRQADGTYQGTVTHFTIWNADFYAVTATLKGCFKNAAGQALSNVGIIGLRGVGYSALLGSGSNDNSSNFTILAVPANRPLELYSPSAPATFAPVAIPALTPNVVNTISPCITATAATLANVRVITSPTTTFTATTPTVTVTVPVATTTVPTTATNTVPAITTTVPVVTTTVPVVTTTVPVVTTTAPVVTTTVPGVTTTVPATTTTPQVTGTAVFAGNYAGTYTGAEVGTFTVVINAAGVVSGSSFSQTYGLTFAVSGAVTTSGALSLTATGSSGSAVFNGSVTAAGAVSGNWNYVQSTTGGTFTGRRI